MSNRRDPKLTMYLGAGILVGSGASISVSPLYISILGLLILALAGARDRRQSSTTISGDSND